MSRKLPVKEQVLLAYYVQYYLKNTSSAMYELHEQLLESMEPAVYEISMNDLFDQGLINGMEEIRNYDETKTGIAKPMITHEGILYINNVLGIQPYASDGSKLEYVRNSLVTSSLTLTLPVVAEYLDRAVAQT